MAHLVARHVERDVVRALILLAITRANTFDLDGLAETPRRYASLTDLPPDSLQRPVSAYAVAKYLGLPYETVRRNVKWLKLAGRCRSVDAGLIVPQAVLGAPRHLMAAQIHYDKAVEFAEAAARLDASVGAIPRPTEGDVSRYVARLGAGYFLDTLRIMARCVDIGFTGVLVLWTLAVANLRRITHDPALATTYASLEDVVPDRLRMGASCYAVSKHLLLPYETTRRAIEKLRARGLVEQDADGRLLVPSRVMSSPVLAVALAELTPLTHSYLARLAEAGLGGRRTGRDADRGGPHRLSSSTVQLR